MSSYGCRSWLAKAGWLFVGTLLAIVLLGFESKPVYGQVEAGTVSGTVKDSTGAVVAGATVTAKNLATGAERSAQSGDNGQRSSGSEILLDGAENVDLFTATVGQAVSPDVVQEYRIITNNFEAQYGRASGGVVNVLTKSGTSAYHGTAWEYNRISAYTANTFDNDSNGIPKGSYVRNQFGYGFGGPILKDKLFFYQSTEFTRVRSSASSLSLVPTPELLALTAPNVQAYVTKYG